MNCPESQTILHAYSDGELSPAESLKIEEHLRACPDCAQKQEAIQDLRTALRKNADALYFRPSRDFSNRVRASLPQPVRAKPSFSFLKWSGWGLAASLAAALLLVLGLFRLPYWSAQEALVDDLVSSHVRSLMGTHLTDVASSDQHAVKPWFNGRLDFSPSVKDFSDRGFPLVGGRLDYVKDRPVAALVFQRNQHYLNLFSWPRAKGDRGGPEEMDLRGYHLFHWVHADMNYWLVSDLNPVEMKDLADLLKSQF